MPLFGLEIFNFHPELLDPIQIVYYVVLRLVGHQTDNFYPSLVQSQQSEHTS